MTPQFKNIIIIKKQSDKCGCGGLTVIGSRHPVAYLLANLRQKGHKLVGEDQTYKSEYKLCYVHGPEGIVIELAEQL